MGRFWIHWTYHKDSYMAHRRDWKTGFEGRYRRTISPTAPANRNVLYNDNHVDGDDDDNHNTQSTGGSPPMFLVAGQHGLGGGVVSSRDSSTTPSGGIRGAVSASSLVHCNNTKNVNDNDNLINNNGWTGHARATSKTVSFTKEELRAFKARRSHHQDTGHSVSDKDTPSSTSTRKLYPSQSSPALRSTASDGSNTSLASAGGGSSFTSARSGSPVSPSKLSPSQSWRTSLDSLHRHPSSSGSSSTSSSSSSSSSGTSPSPRAMTRAMSLVDPLHRGGGEEEEEDEEEEEEEVLMSSSVSQDTVYLPRSTSIDESLARITAIHDSLSRSISMADSLYRSSSSNPGSDAPPNDSALPCEEFSQLSSPPDVGPTSPPLESPSPTTTPVPHDGPITAHPATVTEESPTSAAHKVPLASPPLYSFPQPLSLTPLTPTNPSSFSPKSSLTLNSPQSPKPILYHSLSTPVTEPPYLSFPTTSPSLSAMPPASCVDVDRSNIVVLTYGRTRYQEEIDCDKLSQDIVSQMSFDTKLQALLAPGPEHKTAGHYMQGVFALELRKDLLSSTHAAHPDLSTLATVSVKSPSLVSTTTLTLSDHGSATHTTCNSKSPLPSDSAYFTTSESKAKLLTRIRDSNTQPDAGVIDSQTLLRRKEELVDSIGRKLEILRTEQEAIREEMRLNQELGAEVTSGVVARALRTESDKYKLHVEEIDKITSLLLGLSGRLARAENALLMLANDADLEEKRILESKRDKLSEQLEEAKRLKENIDRRAIQVSKVLNKYLNEDEYADYDHFIKMKAKLIMDAREIDDKIKLGDEQQQALREALFKKP